MARLGKAARQELRLLRAGTNQDRREDFSFTQNQLDSIFGNLATTGRGVARQLDKTQARQMAAIERLIGRRTKSLERNVVGGEAEARRLFGSAMGGVIDEQFAQARGVLRGTANNAQSNREAARLESRGGDIAMAAAREGADSARAGADYALASALGYRARDDASLVAERRAQLVDQAFEAEQAEEDFRRQKAFARFQAQLDSGGGATGAAGFQETAGLIQAAQAEKASPEQVAAIIAQAEIQYNLGPQALKKLRDLAAAGYGEGGEPLLTAPGESQLVDSNGVPLLSTAQQQGINAEAWKAVTNNVDITDPNAAMTALGIARNDDGKYAIGDKVLSSEEVAAAIAYFQREGLRIMQKVASQLEGTTGAATAPTPGQQK